MKRWVLFVIACFPMFLYAAVLHVNASPKTPTFVVTLPANPTTGFEWQIKRYDKALFHLKEKHYQRPRSSLIGAGGMMVYVFALNAGQQHPDNTEIEFSYARSWEPGSGYHQRVVVHF
jgi:inhibitor of cysteine peptidase